MKKVIKSLLVFSLCSLIVTSAAGNTFAVVVLSNDTDQYAVFVKNNLTFTGSSTPAVEGGNAIVNNAVTGLSETTKRVNGGFLYAGSAPEYESGTENYRKNVDQKSYLAKGPYAGIYTGKEPEYTLMLKAFPTLADKGKLPEGQTVNITESGNYTSFNVTTSGNTNVSITTTSADQVIEIRTNTLNIQKPLQVAGPGKVVFYAEEVKSGGTATLNENGDPRNVMIYLSGNKDSTLSILGGSFNIYVGGADANQKITFTGGNKIIRGNVYTPGKVEIQSREIDGFVYAPNSDASVTGGNAVVRGKLVCKNLTIGNSGKVIEANCYSLTEGVANDITQKNAYHVLTSASEGGTITAYDREIEEGTVIFVQAVPAEGYRFVRFEGDQPDQSGNITVTKDITMKAIFERVILPTGYVNGLLGEYFDSSQTINETAIRVKRIDPQIAFNFMHAAPEGTGGQIEAETFAERWTGYIKVPVTGDYTFKTYSDDGVKLTIDGALLIDRWELVNLKYTISAPIHLEAEQLYPITFQHQQMPLYSAVFLFWEAEGVPMAMVPPDAFFVSQETYDAFETPVFVNELSRSGNGLLQQFYVGAEGLQSGDADYQVVDTVDYEWQDGSPDNEVLGDAFSARMTGYIEGKFTELVTLEFIVDDGLRVWVDDEQIINSWEPHSDAVIAGTFNMVAGNKHKIVIEYNDIGKGATCIMRWKSASQELQVIPIQYLYSE